MCATSEEEIPLLPSFVVAASWIANAAKSVRTSRPALLTARLDADFFRLPHAGLQAAIIFGMTLYEVTCFQPDLFPFYGVPGFGPFIQYLVNDHMVWL